MPIASAELNLCFQGFLRAIKLFSWNDGPETAVGGGQWELAAVGAEESCDDRVHRKSLKQELSFLGISGAPKT